MEHNWIRHVKCPNIFTCSICNWTKEEVGLHVKKDIYYTHDTVTLKEPLCLESLKTQKSVTTSSESQQEME